jgi:hypothetical protein
MDNYGGEPTEAFFVRKNNPKNLLYIYGYLCLH